MLAAVDEWAEHVRNGSAFSTAGDGEVETVDARDDPDRFFESLDNALRKVDRRLVGIVVMVGNGGTLMPGGALFRIFASSSTISIMVRVSVRL